MYYCETESLRYGNVLVKVLDKEHRLVGSGAYFGRGNGKVFLQEEIDSPEVQKKLQDSIDEACSKIHLHVKWDLLKQPNASEG